MENSNKNIEKEERRSFIKMISGATVLGLTALATPFRAQAKEKSDHHDGMHEADKWFHKIKGKHRAVFDVTQPHEIFPFAWPKVFLLTNDASGTPEKDCGVVVVLRHAAIGYAFKDKIWEKYGFGEFFKANELGPSFQAADAKTATKTRNPFWNAKPEDFKIPGFGAVPIGISDLQASGVMFCVCNAAMTVYSTVLAEKMKMKQDGVLKEWTEELIPGIQIVPSGVWAVGRAQEHGCKYIFAG